MSAVFKTPKVSSETQPADVQPEVVNDNQIVFELEKKRKKRMGAVSQLLANDRGQKKEKRTLGE